MQVTIDQAGRIVIPKAIRERFHLEKNSVLELEDGRDGILLKVVNASPHLVRDEHGWLTVRGIAPKDFDITKAIEEMREERIREIGGW